MEKNIYRFPQLSLKGVHGFYLSSFLRKIGLDLIGIYIPIYLYHAGYEIRTILLFYFIQSLSFILFSPFGGKIIEKIGFKFGILLSVPFQILSYLLLIIVEKNFPIFLIIPILTAVANFLFFVSYHSLFTKKSHHEKRGGEIATLNIIVMIAGILSPLLGGIIAEKHFSFIFILSSFFILVGSIPYFYMDNLSNKVQFNAKRMFSYIRKKEYRGNIVSFSAYGIEHIIDFILWPIFIISTVHSLEKTGFVISITSGLSLFVYHTIGKMSDRFKKKNIITLASYFYSLFFVLRVFSINMKQIIIFDGLKSLTRNMVIIPLVARIYELADESPNYLEFTVVKENIFNLSRLVVIPVLILVFSFIPHPFIVSFIIGGVAVLGYRYIT